MHDGNGYSMAIVLESTATSKTGNQSSVLDDIFLLDDILHVCIFLSNRFPLGVHTKYFLCVSYKVSIVILITKVFQTIFPDITYIVLVCVS